MKVCGLSVMTAYKIILGSKESMRPRLPTTKEFFFRDMITATHIYWRKYHQSFKKLLVEFREDLACFKSIWDWFIEYGSSTTRCKWRTCLKFIIFASSKFFVNSKLASDNLYFFVFLPVKLYLIEFEYCS